MKSIRRSLGLQLSGAALLLLLGAAASLLTGVRWLLTEQFDGALRAKFKTFAMLIEQEGDLVELGHLEQVMPEFSAPAAPEYLQMWLAGRDDDWVLYRSPSLSGGDLPRFTGTEEEPELRNLLLPDGRAGRALGAEFAIHNYDPGESGRSRASVALVLARGTESLDVALRSLWIGTLVAISLLVSAGFLLGGRVLRRGLRPLDDLARHVASVADPVRAPRFDASGLPAELVPLAESHEQMLARIRDAFERERRTAANIAHELRTPVTELVVLAETIQRYHDDPGESERRLAELREVGDQMSRLIATLLELGRIESGQVPLELEPVDLAEMLHACWKPLAPFAEAKGQSLDAPPPTGHRVRADRVAMSILVTNLLCNAIDHAPPGDRFGCRIENGAERCRLVLTNTAEGLRREDLDKLAEPFWRASAARDDRRRAGIGLSLVRRLAELLEAELAFELEGRQFRVRLGMPAWRPPSDG